MEVDNELYEALAEICRPKLLGTYRPMYTNTEVKILCIDAIMYFMEHQGEDRIDINRYFESKGL